MPDFPGTSVRPPSILSTADPHHGIGGLMTGMAAGGTWPAANRALYVSVLVERTVTVTQMAVWPTAQSGNLDIGIYSETGVRLVSKGSTAVGAAATLQAVDIADTTLNPGTYFLALSVDNTTAAFLRTAGGNAGFNRVFGVQQEALGSVTLPSTATFANPANAYVPLIQCLVMSSVI